MFFTDSTYHGIHRHEENPPFGRICWALFPFASKKQNPSEVWWCFYPFYHWAVLIVMSLNWFVGMTIFTNPKWQAKGSQQGGGGSHHCWFEEKTGQLALCWFWAPKLQRHPWIPRKIVTRCCPLMAEIGRETTLGCKKTLVKNGRTYQPQLVNFQISEPSTNSTTVPAGMVELFLQAGWGKPHQIEVCFHFHFRI